MCGRRDGRSAVQRRPGVWWNELRRRLHRREHEQGLDPVCDFWAVEPDSPGSKARRLLPPRSSRIRGIARSRSPRSSASIALDISHSNVYGRVGWDELQDFVHARWTGPTPHRSGGRSSSSATTTRTTPRTRRALPHRRSPPPFLTDAVTHGTFHQPRRSTSRRMLRYRFIRFIRTAERIRSLPTATLLLSSSSWEKNYPRGQPVRFRATAPRRPPFQLGRERRRHASAHAPNRRRFQSSGSVTGTPPAWRRRGVYLGARCCNSCRRIWDGQRHRDEQVGRNVRRFGILRISRVPILRHAPADRSRPFAQWGTRIRRRPLQASHRPASPPNVREQSSVSGSSAATNGTTARPTSRHARVIAPETLDAGQSLRFITDENLRGEEPGIRNICFPSACT